MLPQKNISVFFMIYILGEVIDDFFRQEGQKRCIVEMLQNCNKTCVLVEATSCSKNDVRLRVMQKVMNDF